MEDIPLQPSKTLADRIGNEFPEISQFAEELSPADVVAEVWPEQPNLKYIHIVARLPSGERFVHWVCRISLTVSRLVFHCNVQCLFFCSRSHHVPTAGGGTFSRFNCLFSLDQYSGG